MKLKAAFTQLTARYPLLGNKYFLTSAGFLVWLLFLDGNNLVLQYKERKELTELRKQRKYYQEQIKSTREKLEAINTSEQSLERYARENYFMKKDGEEIWTLVDTTASED